VRIYFVFCVGENVEALYIVHQVFSDFSFSYNYQPCLAPNLCEAEAGVEWEVFVLYKPWAQALQVAGSVEAVLAPNVFIYSLPLKVNLVTAFEKINICTVKLSLCGSSLY
jgi:hypothetical protein